MSDLVLLIWLLWLPVITGLEWVRQKLIQPDPCWSCLFPQFNFSVVTASVLHWTRYFIYSSLGESNTYSPWPIPVVQSNDYYQPVDSPSFKLWFLSLSPIPWPPPHMHIPHPTHSHLSSGQNEDELSVNANEEVVIIEDLGDGWLKVRKGEDEGYVPQSYVRMLNEWYHFLHCRLIFSSFLCFE